MNKNINLDAFEVSSDEKKNINVKKVLSTEETIDIHTNNQLRTGTDIGLDLLVNPEKIKVRSNQTSEGINLNDIDPSKTSNFDKISEIDLLQNINDKSSQLNDIQLDYISLYCIILDNTRFDWVCLYQARFIEIGLY